MGFSYKFFMSTFYEDPYDGIISEISKLITDKKYEANSRTELFHITDLLKNQPDIENSYVMGQFVNYAYYSGSKFIYTDFHSGESNDSLNDFVKRKNWSEYDLYISNIHSYPRDKHDLLNPVADYVVYHVVPDDTSPIFYHKTSVHTDVSILATPDNDKLPSNFELLYKSDRTFVYKINNIEN